MWMRPRTRRLLLLPGKEQQKFVCQSGSSESLRRHKFAFFFFGGQSSLLSTSSNPPEFLICIWSLVYWSFGARHAKSAVNKCLLPDGHAVDSSETPFARRAHGKEFKTCSSRSFLFDNFLLQKFPFLVLAIFFSVPKSAVLLEFLHVQALLAVITYQARTRIAEIKQDQRKWLVRWLQETAIGFFKSA